MTDIFLSYKAEDRARVKPLVDALTAEGLSVWWDVHIEGGAAWRETIRSHLDGAGCVIVVWSEASVGPAGHFVQDEASRARRRGVYLPIAIDPTEPPLGFGQEHALKLVGWGGGRRDPRFQDILAAARAIISGGPRPTPTARARAVRHRSSWPALATGFLAAAVLAGLLIAQAPARLCEAAAPVCPWAPSKAPRNSIAVLPLANFSADPTQDYFADGLTEELISRLASLGGLQVAGRTSSFKFKASKQDSQTIAAALGVGYLLDGSVRRSGPTVRVSAHLIDAATGYERWNQTYDRELKDILAVQSGIAQAVADALKVRLLGSDIASLSGGGTNNPEAYDAFLRGRRLFDAGGEEGIYQDALGRFDAAIAADPRFAAAHAARARTLLALAGGFVPQERMRRTLDDAVASARLAAALAPNLPQAQAALGEALYRSALDLGAARRAYDTARALGGGDADILTLYSDFSSETGDQTAALTAIRRAATLDPLNPRVFRTMGYVLTGARLYPPAISAFRRALDLNPGAPGAHAATGDALYLLGRYAEAKREYDREPVTVLRSTGRALSLRRLGDAAGANAALAALVADRSTLSYYQQGQIFAQWGDLDRAFGALDAAARTGDTGLVLLKSDPMMDPLRRDPRWTRALVRLADRREP